MATNSTTLALAIQHHQAGRLPSAERIYRQIIARDPNHADAWHLLGVIAHQEGKQELAIEYILRAIGLNATVAMFHNNLAEAHRAGGLIPEAIAAYRQALQLKPDYAEAHNNLGIALREQGNLEEATACFRQATQLMPNYAAAHINLGNVHNDQANLQEAIACYRRALMLKPDHAVAHNNLANVLKQQGNLDEAIACYRRALILKPDYAVAHNNLGNVLKERGNREEAIACYRRALELKPDYPAAHHNLGNLLKEQGNLDQAIACYRRAVALQPDYAAGHHSLAVALNDQGQMDEAVVCYQRTLKLKPDCAEVHNDLGNALIAQGNPQEAVACYRRAVQIKSDFYEAHNNLGNALYVHGNTDEAIACYHRALELAPNYVAAHNNLGNARKKQGNLDEAIACYQRALELEPEYAPAHKNLGNAFKAQGRLEEAIAAYRRAIQLKPDYATAHSNLLYALHFCPGLDARAIGEEHRKWSQRFAEPLAGLIVPQQRGPSSDRRLRIGYVSPDFRMHPVATFLAPLLESHDHQRFEIFSYSDVILADALTARLRSCADAWREIRSLSDESVAQLIRQDGIDILVDLTMHMADNRLLVFARKPAPVQVTYLAYCGTTGLRTIDYRLTDPYLDPPGEDRTVYAEATVCLPDTYWCYQPIIATPPVNALPAVEAGYVSFGCLNNFCKVSVPALTAWCRLLQATPGSRLLLHANTGSHRDRVRRIFAEQGIAPDRLAFVGLLPIDEYFGVYQRIDVALDPFPYGGGTTTCDAIWMGVPTVSLAGQTAVGRGGLSILSNLGLADLVARDTEQYVQIASGLANDLPRLASLRATLRERMQESCLMDAPRFARDIENAYRSMWQTRRSG